MTALTVLYARFTGLPLAALTTTVPGSPPSLTQSATIQLSQLAPTAQKVQVQGELAQNPPPVHPQPFTVRAADVAIVVVEAEFDDPAEVFKWQVVTTTTPDGAQHFRLDRLATAQFGADLNGDQFTLKVPRLGNLEQLNYEIYDTSGRVGDGTLKFASLDPKTVTFTIHAKSPPVVLVQGYPLAVARAAGDDPQWP